MMSATSPGTVSVRLAAIRFSSRATRLSQLRCTECGSPLTVHQPSESGPERLLATCEGCGEWYLLDCAHGSGDSLMVRLPDRERLRRAVDGRPQLHE